MLTPEAIAARRVEWYRDRAGMCGMHARIRLQSLAVLYESWVAEGAAKLAREATHYALLAQAIEEQINREAPARP